MISDRNWMCQPQSTSCVNDINKGFDCFIQTSILSFSVFSNWSCSLRSKHVGLPPTVNEWRLHSIILQSNVTHENICISDKNPFNWKGNSSTRGNRGGFDKWKKLEQFFLFAPLWKDRSSPNWTLSSAKILSSTFNNFIQDFWSSSAGAEQGRVLSPQHKVHNKEA